MATKVPEKNRFRILSFLRNRNVQLIAGVVLFFALVYVAISLISFFSAGKNDSSIVAEYSTYNRQYVIKKSETPKTDELKAELRAMRMEKAKIQHKIENLTGYRGAVIAENLINKWLGLGVFFVLFFVLIASLRLIGVRKITLWKSFLLCVYMSMWLSLLLAFTIDRLTADSFVLFGGSFGEWLRDILISNIGNVGTILVLAASGLIFAILSISGTIPFFKRIYEQMSQKGFYLPIFKKNRDKKHESEHSGEDSVKVGDSIVDQEWIKEIEDKKEVLKTEKTEKIFDVGDDISDVGTDNGDMLFEEVKIDEDQSQTPNKDDSIEEIPIAPTKDLKDLEPYDPKANLSMYVIPKFYDKYKDKPLLTEYQQSEITQNEEEKLYNRKRIVDTLQKFGVGISKIYETVGPTITLYEIVPQDGVRINRIRNLADDIMLSLAATGIRIIAPIPGKGTIGIEVPNANPQIVSMFATIAAKKFQESKYELPIAMGRTITNEIFMFDLCKMPHLLVAGATGQGKSVGLNAIITSLLFKKHPAELKFVLIDPKKVEFNIYADIERHFLAKLPDEAEPVITDVEKVKQTLNSICKEMDSRYDLLKSAHSRNIKEYNEKFVSRRLNPNKGHKYLPYIVVIVDEFGDLIMTAGKEVEMPIARIAQLARAVGIHMIIATQRPSVNIITGVIKANFPARIAFKVSSGVDSKTIIDGSGAQQLIGRGDMLFSQGNEPVRVQCAFVDTPEVENIVHFIGNQQGYTSAFPLPEPDVAESSGSKDAIDTTKRDSIFDDVAKYVVSVQRCSSSEVQRKFEIGFARAARIVDQLEANGIVSGLNGSKPRMVLVATEYELEKILKGR